MLLEGMDDKFISDVDNINNLTEAKTAIKNMAQHIKLLEWQLEKILQNLTSDNIREIDFGMTRYKNYKKTILKDYVTKEELREELRKVIMNP